MSSKGSDMNSLMGIQFEQFTQTLLKRLGFVKVHATQPSRDYGIDVLAKLNYHGKFGVQCKHTNVNNLISYRAVEETVSGVKYYHLNKGIVLTNGYFTPAARHGAMKNHIVLWNHNSLVVLTRMFNAHLTIYDLLDERTTLLPLIKELRKYED